MGFSLTEKLAVAGAFLALVAMAIGTEEDPGVVAETAPQAVIRPQPVVVAESQQPRSSSATWITWRRARDAAAEDEAGSIGVEKAPEPPPRAF